MKRRRIRFATAFVVVFAFLSFASASFGQKIYLLAAGDVQDPTIGESVAIDISRISRLFKDRIPAERLVLYNDPYYVSYDDYNVDAFDSFNLKEKRALQTVSLSPWSGPDLYKSTSLKRDLTRALARCPAGSNDIVVCYWSGHGAFDDEGHYLVANGVRIYRKEILRALEAKGARFNALITDSCNQFHRFDAEVSVPCRIFFFDQIPKIFLALFFNCRGTLDVNASSPGEEAGAYDDGGAFTYATCQLFNQYYAHNPTWRQMFCFVDARVARTFTDIKQKTYVWSYPTFELSEPLWSTPRYRPKVGDRILAVDGRKINDKEEFSRAIVEADSEVVLTLVRNDAGSDDQAYLKTRLLPKGSSFRLGIYVGDVEKNANQEQSGVVVTKLTKNSPAVRCQYLQSGDLDDVL